MLRYCFPRLSLCSKTCHIPQLKHGVVLLGWKVLKCVLLLGTIYLPGKIALDVLEIKDLDCHHWVVLSWSPVPVCLLVRIV